MAEEESIIFSTGQGSIDRASIDEKQSKGIPDKEESDKKKKADSVLKDALGYFTKKWDKSVKDKDPGFDRAKIEYKLAGGPSKFNAKNQFRKKLDAGESIESIKDIDPLAEADAERYLKTVESIKKSTAIEVADKLDINDLEDDPLYEKIETEVYEKLKENNIDKSFDLRKLFQEVSKLAGYYDPTNVSAEFIKLLKKPDYSFGLSAMSKILENQGLDNESVSSVSKKYEDNLNNFIQMMGGKNPEKEFKDIVKKEEKIESSENQKETSEDKKGDTKKEKSESKIEETKIEEKKEGIKEEDKKEEKEEPESIEKVTQDQTVKKEDEDKTPDNSKKITKKEEVKNTPKKKKKTNKDKDGEKSDYIQDYIKSIFQPFISGDGGDGGSGGSGVSTDTPKSKKEIADLFLSTLGSNKKGDDKGKKGKGKTGTKPPEKETKKEGIKNKSEETQKNQETNETSSSEESIKETTIQNLNSRITKESPANQNNSEVEKNKTLETEKNETNSTLEETAKTTTNKENPENKKTSESFSNSNTENESMKSLEKKMDAMISILSEVSETLQGPLVVKSSNKFFK